MGQSGTWFCVDEENLDEYSTHVPCDDPKPTCLPGYDLECQGAGFAGGRETITLDEAIARNADQTAKAIRSQGQQE